MYANRGMSHTHRWDSMFSINSESMLESWGLEERQDKGKKRKGHVEKIERVGHVER